MSALTVKIPENQYPLQLLEQACRAVAEAKDLWELKKARDKAEAIKHYLAEQGYSRRLCNDAAEIKVRAERRLGELLAEKAIKGGERHKCHDGTYERRPTIPVEVSKKQSAAWQSLNRIPEETFEKHISGVKSANKDLTTSGLLKIANQLAAKRKLAKANGEAETCTVADLDDLVKAGKTFGTLYIDPPWQYGNQGTRASTDNHYPTMPLDEIAALPVKLLGAKLSHLHLWTTNAFLFDAKKLLDAWGYEYKSIFVWVKPQMGIGNYWRVSHEFMLLGVRGNCPFMDKGQMSWMRAERSGHSTKPGKIRKLIEAVSPGPRLELFARNEFDGWSTWGNQISRTIFHSQVSGV